MRALLMYYLLFIQYFIIKIIQYIYVLYYKTYPRASVVTIFFQRDPGSCNLRSWDRPDPDPAIYLDRPDPDPIACWIDRRIPDPRSQYNSKKNKKLKILDLLKIVGFQKKILSSVLFLFRLRALSSISLISSDLTSHISSPLLFFSFPRRSSS